MTGVAEVGTGARYFEESAAVRARPDLRVLRVAGDDARSWLNGQVTNDVRSTTPGDTVYALVVTPKGKIVADVWVLDRGDTFALAVPASAWDATLGRLETQIFMEDVDLEEERIAIVSVQGPRAADVVREASIDPNRAHRVDELGSGGVFVSVEPEALEATRAALERAATRFGGGEVGEAAFELARLRRGRPRFEADFGDHVFPQEAGLKQLAVSFAKGCYVGQEAVYMLEHRGRPRHVLVRIDCATATASGVPLTDAQGSEVGTVTSTALDPDADRTLMLGYVKRDLAEAGAELRVGNTPVTVRGVVGVG